MLRRYEHVRKHGAVCDAVYNPSTGLWTGTDNTAAFQRAMNAASDAGTSFAERAGTVEWTRGERGKGYLLSGALALTISQGGPLNFRLRGDGMDSPLIANCGAAADLISVAVSGVEGFQGKAEGIAFVPRDTGYASTHATCLSALKLNGTVGHWIVRDNYAAGVWGKNAVFHLNGCDFTVENLHNAGCSSGNDPSNAGYFLYLDQPQVVSVRSLHSFYEYHYLGTDYAAGMHVGLIGINPTADSSFGPSMVRISELTGCIRDGILVNAYPPSGSAGCGVLHLHNFRVSSGGPSGVVAGFAKSVIIENGSWNAGAAYYLADLYSVGKTEIRNVRKLAAATSPNIRADSGCGDLIIDNTDYGTLTCAATFKGKTTYTAI